MVTRWWRGLSLRGKVTGVTVALLVVGLVAAGVGTAVFLRNTLVGSVDTQVDALARTEAAASLLDFTVNEGRLSVSPREEAPHVDYFVAVYDPVDGALLALVGGRGGPEPLVPDSYALDYALTRQLQTDTLTSADGDAEFRATVSVREFAQAGTLYPQLVAVPLTAANRTITNYITIYSILALLIVIGGAVLTRVLVTLTFRSLGQVETTAMAIAAGDYSQRLTDIEPPTTEVGRLKAALNAMLRRVDAAITQRDATVQQMRRFIGDASHELRTPLVTVRGYAELYRMGAITDDEEVAQSMGRIESEAKRMGLLVEDLLALARLDERRDVALGPVDLRPVARDAALDVRATSPQRTVTVIDTTVELPMADAPPTASTPVPESPGRPGRMRAGATLALLRRRPRPVSARQAADSGAPPTDSMLALPNAIAPIVIGDENRIRQVVANLLGNARRFTTDDSPIELRVGVDPDAELGWIEVIDHGEGVPDQIKDKIFQRFWRADTSRARETGGTGLGLSIVASIVEALHGSVYVTDTPGGGATFRVGFPLSLQREPEEHRNIETQPLERLRPSE